MLTDKYRRYRYVAISEILSLSLGIDDYEHGVMEVCFDVSKMYGYSGCEFRLVAAYRNNGPVDQTISLRNSNNIQETSITAKANTVVVERARSPPFVPDDKYPLKRISGTSEDVLIYDAYIVPLRKGLERGKRH